MDQTALGNIIVMRNNSYDQGNSWKEYIPEVDLTSSEWQYKMHSIFENSEHWRQKSLEYYENFWRPEKVFLYLENQLKSNM